MIDLKIAKINNPFMSFNSLIIVLRTVAIIERRLQIDMQRNHNNKKHSIAADRKMQFRIHLNTSNKTNLSPVTAATAMAATATTAATAK
jgi:hypothetical protein